MIIISVQQLTVGPHVRRKPNRVVENCLTCNIELTQEEQDAIADILARNQVRGERYVSGPLKQHLHLWG